MTRIDPNSETWATIHALVSERHDKALRQVSRRNLDPISTEFARGEIALAEAVMALAGPAADGHPKSPSARQKPGARG